MAAYNAEVLKNTPEEVMWIEIADSLNNAGFLVCVLFLVYGFKEHNYVFYCLLFFMPNKFFINIFKLTFQDVPVTPDSCKNTVNLLKNGGENTSQPLSVPVSARRTWTANETKVLIGFYGDRKSEFDVPRKKKQAFENILHDLESSGILVIFIIEIFCNFY